MIVCIPTIARFDLLDEAIELYKLDPAVERIFVIDNSCGQYQMRQYDEIQAVPVITIVPNQPMTVAQSWNYFLRHIDGDLLIANDDAFPRPNCVTNMAQALADDEDQEIGIFFGCVVENTSDADNNYSMFCVRRWLWERIGGFFEEYKPGYYEDCEFDWERRLLDVKAQTVMDAFYTHVGSATIKSYGNDGNDPRVKLHNASMRRNARIYVARWGGLPGREVYKTPFNGKR